ncbi:MAG: carboxypeptidase-like regulatory domain-containing protein [Acidobacteriota bacterium]
MRRLGALLLILTGLVWMSGGGWGGVLAQNQNGTIRGLVTGPTGEVVAGATVRLVREETGTTRTVRTGANGDYAFTLLAPGAYRIEIDQPGGSQYVYRTGLSVNQDLRIDVAFSGAIAKRTVEVLETLTPLKR